MLNVMPRFVLHRFNTAIRPGCSIRLMKRIRRTRNITGRLYKSSSAIENGTRLERNPTGMDAILNVPLAKIYSARNGMFFARRRNSMDTGVRSKRYFLFIFSYLPGILPPGDSRFLLPRKHLFRPAHCLRRAARFLWYQNRSCPAGI